MHKPIYYFGMMMAVVYIIVGLFFLIMGGKYTTTMPSWFHVLFGILLIVYGIFRLTRLWQNSKQQ